MLCPACGAVARAGDRFCRRCGCALANGAPPPGAPDAGPPALPPAGLPDPPFAVAPDPPPEDPPDLTPGAPYAMAPAALTPFPALTPHRPRPLGSPTLALLAVVLVLLLAATNPSPAAYVAWAAGRVVPAATFVPARDAAYLAVERATVSESYGICTVFQTSLRSGTMTVLGIMGQFLTIGGAPRALPAPSRPRYRRRGVRSVQI